MMKQNGMIFLTKDSFIFKIGNLHKDDLERVEDMYRKSFRYFINNYRSYCGVLFISDCNGMDIGDQI